MGGARVTTLVTLRKCTLGHKREIKTLKFVSASTKGFKGGLAWIKPSKKDMAVTFSYSESQKPRLVFNLLEVPAVLRSFKHEGKCRRSKNFGKNFAKNVGKNVGKNCGKKFGKIFRKNFANIF